MSATEVSRFVTLALEDANMRRLLESSSDQAFQGFILTGEERQAIVGADELQLRHMGLDPMTAHSWRAFHDVEEFAPDLPDAPGDLPPGAP